MMGALTKDRAITRRLGADQAEYQVAAATKIYAGAMVAVNAQGYAVPAADTAGLKFVGVARNYVNNTDGQNGDEVVVVWIRDIFDFVAADMTAADVGKPVFARDDQTVALSSTNSVGVGIIIEVESATKVWVDIAPANRRTGAAQDSVTATVATGVTATVATGVTATVATGVTAEVTTGVTAADAAAATGDAPTKEEFDAVVTLANDNKAVTNALLTLANDNKDVANALLTLANDNKDVTNALLTLANDNKTVTNALLALANENKAAINGLLTKLKAAGIIGS